MTNKMKIIENEENNENKKGFSSTQYRGRRKPRKSVAHSAVKLSDVMSEEPLDDGNVAVKVEDRVPVVTPRGRGRPRKNTLVSDAVSPLAKVSATPSRGRGRPRKGTSLSKSPLEQDSPLPSERRGRGRPKKIVDASDVSTTLEKSDAELDTDETDLQTKDDSVPHRGRGRPRKNFGSIRGRGRPRKNFGSFSGRGRPRKNFGSLSASTSFIGDKADSTSSHGEGSARKILKNTGGTTLTKGTVGHQNDFKRFGAIQLLAQALAKHGRGRPRKGTGIKDAVQLLQKDPVLSKPGRGRPPKSIKRIFAMKLLAKAMAMGCQDEALKNISITDVTEALKATDTSRRGRGRPRSRGRGRPRKVVVEEKDPSVTPRGRGRPRKNLGTPSTTLLSGAAVTPVTPMTPRGRGRPRKNPPAADAVLSSEVTEPVTGSSESVETMSDVQLDIKPKTEIL